MLRDDQSRAGLRELRRWLLPALITLLGVTLYFALGRQTRAMASPIRVEAPEP